MGEYIRNTDIALERDTQTVFRHIKYGKGKPNNLNLENRLAIFIGARYLATLNDIEFMDLIKSEHLITNEQFASLTRSYKEIKSFKEDRHLLIDWEKKVDEQNGQEQLIR